MKLREPPDKTLTKAQTEVIRWLRKEQIKLKEKKMSYKLIEAIKAIDYKNLLARAAWTFLQAFLAVVLLMGEQIVTLIFEGDWSALQALVVATVLGGIAAGLSALKTVIVEVIRELKKAK